MEDSTQRNVVVVGAGVGGLSAAIDLIESDPNVHVTILDAKNRVGGRIQNIDLTPLPTPDNPNPTPRYGNECAEYIDSDQKLKEIAEKVGAKLIPSGTDDEYIKFRMPNGTTLNEEEFLELVRPIKEKTAADKEAIAKDPDGKRAQHLDNISLAQYMNELTLSTKDQPILTKIKFLMTRFANFVTRKPRTSKEMAQYLASTYTSECGQDPSTVSALQYLRDSSSDPDLLISSDCAFNVEGGTEKLMLKMKEYLENSGRVNFQLGTKVTGIAQEGGKTILGTMHDGQQQNLATDQVALATETFTLKNIQGLNNLRQERGKTIGYDPTNLGKVGYALGTKVTLKEKEGANLGCFTVYGDGWQAWSGPEQGNITLLIGGKNIHKRFPDQNALINYCLDEFAKANDSTVNKIFDLKAPMMINHSPRTYPSPSIGEGLMLSRETQAATDFARQTGIGIINNAFCPETGTGFMDTSVKSASLAVQALNAQWKEHGQQQVMQQSQQMQQQPGQWQQREAARATSRELAGAGAGIR